VGILRWTSRRHSASIADGTAPLALTPPANGDSVGNSRLLIGVRTQAGADIQRILVNSPDWGPRSLEIPPIGQGGSIAGMRTDWLPHPQFIGKNQLVNYLATQNSGGAQTVTVDGMYIEYGEGMLPASIQATVAELTDMFFSGTANSGQMPTIPSATVSLEVGSGSVYSPIALAGVGAGIPNMQISYSDADGQGAQAPMNTDVLQESMWTNVPPLSNVNNNDNVDMFVEDQSASAFVGWVRLQKLTGGKVNMNRFSPPFGTFP